MAKYLMLRNIEILKANANPAWYLVGPPALTAYHGFIQALLLSLINEDVKEAKNLILHEGFAIIHHDIQMLGAMNKFGNTFLPNQISSAHAYDKDDYVKTSTNLASQPTATCNLLIDLIIRLPEKFQDIDVYKVKKFLYMGKIAGGKINFVNDLEKNILTLDTCTEVSNQVKKGFYIVDRNDLLKSKDNQNSLDLLLKNTQRVKKGEKSENESWLVPNTVGYLCLTNFKEEYNSLNGNKVAYAEPVVTMTQYCPVRKQQEIPFWTWNKEVINNGKKLFILKGEVK